MDDLNDDPVIREIRERLDRQAIEIVALKGAMAAIMDEQSEPIFENTDHAILGLVFGVTTVMEILVMRELISDQQLRGTLSIIQKKFAKNRQPDPAVIIGMMIKAFGEQRELVRSLLMKPPEGTA